MHCVRLPRSWCTQRFALIPLPPPRPSQLVLLQLCRQVALGMQHLHARRLTHGDLRAANVLMAEDPASPLGLRAMVRRRFVSYSAVTEPWGFLLGQQGIDVLQHHVAHWHWCRHHRSDAAVPHQLNLEGTALCTRSPYELTRTQRALIARVPACQSHLCLSSYTVERHSVTCCNRSYPICPPPSRCQVTDYGFTRLMLTGRATLAPRPHGAATHLAPESWADGAATRAGDVFAFGILSEWAAGRCAYTVAHNGGTW